MANLTAKELTLLEEQPSREKNPIKKDKLYAIKYTDPQHSTRCEQAAEHHHNHYNTLLNQLN